MENIRKRITEADGYQRYLIAPEQGYRHLVESSLTTIRGPAEAAVDALIQGFILSRNNAYHQRSAAASLVHGVYVLEEDRQERHEDRNALALPWWTFFHFLLFLYACW
ncbi:hypothetical protein VNO80_08554 [Phaseolus coccineus]|uniref:Uncharacterized protein n=1 Tax=Phaseolus coccineus TaxID=3886 RepID=A0AAN9RBP4_PHACN